MHQQRVESNMPIEPKHNLMRWAALAACLAMSMTSCSHDCNCMPKVEGPIKVSKSIPFPDAPMPSRER